MTDYAPSDWYWTVGGDATQVFSSKQSAFVPPTDADYQEWLASGGATTRIDTMVSLQDVLSSAGVPPYAPVSPLQARKALRAAGLLDTVNAAVRAATPDIQDAWDYASSVKRTDPMVTAIGAQLNLTPAMLDQLFVAAAGMT